MKPVNQICRESSSFLGGKENACIIADAIRNNDADTFKNAIKTLPSESFPLVRILLNSSVPARNQR